MSARLLLTTTVVAAAALLPAATAGAAKAPSYPTVSKISPMRANIGQTMTLTGKNFVKGKSKNTVVFRRPGKKVVFVKADGLSTTRIRFKVPEKLRTLLGKKSGQSVPTTFQIRVLAKRFGKTYTTVKKSPVIVPAAAAAAPTPEETKKAAEAAAAAAAPAAAGGTAPAPDCDGDSTPDASDADDDNDLLSDAVEAAIGTQRCAADTDSDGMTDGWEYQSAVDLNQESCTGDYPTPCAAALPYPGKRPYPNPRDGSDAGIDFDGDWLTSGMEYTAWSRKAVSSPAHNTLTNMWYSNGKQASQDTSAAPGCRGATVPTTTAFGKDVTTAAYRVYSLDRFGRHAYDGCLNDAERDEDGDYLSNYMESTGPMSSNVWWTGNVEDEKTYSWVAYTGTDWLDADSDGDGRVDGTDDQDHDDFWNMEEVARGPATTDDTGTPIMSDPLDANGVDTGAADIRQRYGLWVQPFNPCLPAVMSRTCPPTIPLSGDIWAPFAKDVASRQQMRWPLYDAGIHDDEVWTPVGAPTQNMPAAQPGQGVGGEVEHPLPRIY